MTYEDKFKFDYAQIGGIRLHYATAGEGERLIVLLHGFPEFWYSWRHQIEALSDEYTVVAPDMRGYNLSEKPPHVRDYAVENLIDDITGLIHHFGRRQAAVIGHDWGAAVAWAMAASHPEMLWKVGSLQVPPMPVWRKNLTVRQALASWYMLFFQIPALPEWLLSRNDFALLENSLRPAAVDNNEIFTEKDIAEFKASWNRPGALTAAINFYRANFPRMFFSNTGSPQTEQTDKIRVPALFIYGEKDRFIMRETVKNVGEFIDAPFEEFHIPDAGHWVQQEAAETVTQILREFLADKQTE
jgi:pimeloyl-ACP methyl ester carboxylesterase